MRVAIIRPNYSSHIVAPPLGMGYVSAYLKSRGHETKIVDGLNLNLNNDQIVQECINFGAKLVGIYVLSAFFLDAIKLINELHNKSIMVVLGGTQPTFMPKYTMDKTNADFLVMGEAETTMADLLDALENDKSCETIPGLITKKNFNPIERPFTDNLDLFPFPDWDQIDPRKYKKAPHGGFIKSFPYAPIVSTRGCPYRCTFCASPKLSKRKIRFRSPENVVSEIKLLKEKFGIKEFHFEDDNLTLRREHAKKICELLIEQNIKINWACPNGIRADKLDDELAALMKKAGCYYVAFGIESGNQDILDKVKKDISLEKIEQGVRIANKAGIMSQGFFIFGLPGETEQTINNTIQFAKRIPLTRAQFLLLDVMPGTELWDTMDYESKKDWGIKSYHDVTWVPPTVSVEILKNAVPRAFKQFYFRPKQFFSIIRFIRPQQLPFLFKRLFAYNLLGTKEK